MDVHALSRSFGNIVNCITTTVTIQNTFTGQTLQTEAIWDTGATNSVITETCAQQLGLVCVSKTIVNSVHGSKESNVYYLNITLHNEQITIKSKVTECSKLSRDDKIGILIGMDIINQGDFSISNFGGNTVMTFRIPSMQKIDFVEGIKNGQPLIKGNLPGRNDRCFCGSGKKYKHCHGKQ